MPATTRRWLPSASQDARELRARVYSEIRRFFARRKVLEVETPMLSVGANTDPNIHSLQSVDRFLRTSPEFAMKRLLAAGAGPIYELGRVFRAEESGRLHNPEFTMLEWYRPDFDYHQLMIETGDLIVHLAEMFEHKLSVVKLSYREAALSSLGLDVCEADDRELLSLVQQRGWFDGELTRSQSLDVLFSMAVTDGFAENQLTLVYDFPACQSALARIHPENPRLAMRFELLWGALELANGYDELLDGDELPDRFESDNVERHRQGLPMMPIDESLLEAMTEDLPPCAGVALGVDRLLMRLGGFELIDQVLNFSYERA